MPNFMVALVLQGLGLEARVREVQANRRSRAELAAKAMDEVK